jgi:hypothetical protein
MIDVGVVAWLLNHESFDDVRARGWCGIGGRGRAVV